MQRCTLQFSVTENLNLYTHIIIYVVFCPLCIYNDIDFCRNCNVNDSLYLRKHPLRVVCDEGKAADAGN